MSVDENNQLALIAVPSPQREKAPARSPSSNISGAGGNLFRLSRPKHVVSGLKKGAWNISAGVVSGVGILVCAPIAGACQNGAKGFATGLGKGVVGVVALPIAGLVLGAAQVGRGVCNTPVYCIRTRQQKVYDSQEKRWIYKYPELDDDFRKKKIAYESFLATRQTQKANASAPNIRVKGGARVVADTEYYDVLQIPTDATQAEIRKSYYKLAKECHPDKQKEDPDAKEKFQKLGEAYQVLGDVARREQYDRDGKSATEKMDFIDSGLFFAMLFGSEALEPYIGRLKLASMVEVDGDEKSFTGVDPREQAYRECHLAVQLRDRLMPGVAGLRETHDMSLYTDWTTGQRAIADSLCNESFGAPLVDAIGFVYRNYADEFIGRRACVAMGGTMAKLKRRRRQFNILCDTVQAATKATQTTREAMKVSRKREAARESPPGPSEQAEADGGHSQDMSPEEVEATEKSLKHILATMLQLCIVDLSTTLRAAAKKVLNERGADDHEKSLRATALRDLGRIFQEAAKAHISTHEDMDAREQMQEAFIKMTQKLDEQNDPANGDCRKYHQT